MNIRNTTYIVSYIPSSSVPCSSNVVPPPHSCGPLGSNVATSHVRTAVDRPVVSQVQVPPVVSRGHVHTSRGHVTTSEAYIPISRVYIPNSRAYIPTYGVSHGKSHGMTYEPYYGTQYGQGSSPYGGGYQKLAYSPNYGFVAPTSQAPPHYGASTPPFTGQIGGGYYVQGHGGNHTYMN